MLKHIKEFREFNSEADILNEGFFGDIFDKLRSIFTRVYKKPAQKKVLTDKKKVEKSPIYGEHMFYLAHQQGPSGAATLIKILEGKKKLTPQMRNKLVKNMPSSDIRYTKVLRGKDIEAVRAFLDYQKGTWSNYKKEALTKIKEVNNTKVKYAIQKVTTKNLSKDFLTTVAYKESRFNPNPSTNKSYTGLFQIGSLAWAQLKKNNPSKYKGNKPPIDPVLNAQAGHDYLNWSFEQFKKLVGN
jgi:hypothetical protein